MKKIALSILTGLFIAALPVCGVFAQDEAANVDLKTLQAEIEILKQGQKTILDELKEIKKLQARKGKPKQVEAVNLVMNVADDPYKGAPDAKVVLIEMTDFQCPFCARHVKNVMPKIEKEYVETGKLKYVVRDFPLGFHKQAQKASEAAHCAGEEGKYWEMYDLLFENQKALGLDQLAEYAKQLQLDGAAFNACLESDRYAGKINESIKVGSKAGVRGTPTIFLGLAEADGKVKVVKRLRGALAFAIFQQNIDEVLASSK